MFRQSIKEIDMLLSKGMSNIYLYCFYWRKKRHSQDYDFPTQADITEFENSLQLKNLGKKP